MALLKQLKSYCKVPFKYGKLLFSALRANWRGVILFILLYSLFSYLLGFFVTFVLFCGFFLCKYSYSYNLVYLLNLSVLLLYQIIFTSCVINCCIILIVQETVEQMYKLPVGMASTALKLTLSLPRTMFRFK